MSVVEAGFSPLLEQGIYPSDATEIRPHPYRECAFEAPGLRALYPPSVPRFAGFPPTNARRVPGASILLDFPAIGAGDPVLLKQLAAFCTFRLERCLAIWANNEVVLHSFSAVGTLASTVEKSLECLRDIHGKVEPDLAAGTVILLADGRAAIFAEGSTANGTAPHSVPLRM